MPDDDESSITPTNENAVLLGGDVDSENNSRLMEKRLRTICCRILATFVRLLKSKKEAHKAQIIIIRSKHSRKTFHTFL